MVLNIRGQMTWGLGDPDAAQAFFERLHELPYAGETAYAQQVADGIGRCHTSRGELAQARALLSDAKPTWVTHSLQPLVDLWEGNWDRLARVGDRSRAAEQLQAAVDLYRRHGAGAAWLERLEGETRLHGVGA